MKRCLLLSAAAIGAAVSTSFAMETATVRPDPASPGDIVVIDASHMPKRATFGLALVPFVKWGGTPRGFVGIDVEAGEGTSPEIELRWTFAPPVRRRIEIRRSERPEERVPFSPEPVDPPAELAEQMWSDSQLLEQVWRVRTSTPQWKQRFLRPLNTEVTSAFGLQRLFDGGLRGVHDGVDLWSRVGAPVRAANSGKVLVARELHLTGSTVVIDHGLGLMTVYAHLDEIAVLEGERVGRADLVGYAGASGRVPGPRLHWGARLLRARVDPMQLLDLEPP